MKLRLLIVCLLASICGFSQSIHNGDLQVLGTFDASVGSASKPMPTVMTDPSGSCVSGNAMVLNNSTGSQKGHISACVGGAWNLLNGTNGVSNLRTNGSGTGIGPWPFSPSTADTVRIFDDTPSTGITAFTLQAGPNQGINNMLQIQDLSGTTQSYLAWGSGYPFWLTYAPTSVGTFGTYGISATGDSIVRLKIGLDSGAPFLSMGPGSGALDVGLERSAGGQLSVTQGQSFSSLGDLQLRKLTASNALFKGSSSGSITLQAGTSPTTYTWTLPSADGSGALTSNGAGVLTVTPLAASATTDATNAANISSGTLSASRIPASITSNTSGNAGTATALAAAPAGCSTGLYSQGISATGTAACAQVNYSQLAGTAPVQSVNGSTGVVVLPLYNTMADNGVGVTQRSALNFSTEFSVVDNAGGARTDVSVNSIASGKVSGLVASATTDTTNAANITTGTLPAARLPSPSASTLGGVESATAASHQWINSISTSGVPALSQPAFSDLSGAAASGQLPLSTFEMFWPAGTCTASASPSLGWDAPATGTEATAAGCGGSNLNQAYASFASTGTPSLLRSYMLPHSFSSTNGADVYVNYLTATGSGTFTLAMDVVCTPANGSTTNDPAFTSNNFFAPGTQTAPSIASEVQTISATGLTWPGACTANSIAHFRLIRTDTSGTATTVLVTGVTLVGRRTL